MNRGFTFLGACAAILLSTATADADPNANRALTVYQGGFGLITESRTVRVGAEPVLFRPVSPLLDPGTVMLTAEPPVKLQEQTFLAPNLNQTELLRAFSGKEVLAIRIHPTTGEEIVEKAFVLDADGGPVLRIGDRVETAFPGRIAFPGVPTSLHSEPALRFVLSGKEKNVPVSVSYLSAGLGWKADYVAQLAADRSHLTLTAFATVENNSGIAYPATRLRLVAGQVNRMQAGILHPPMARGMAAKAMLAESDAVRPPVASGEYYVYEISEPVNVLQGGAQQFSILQASRVGVESSLLLQSHVSPYPAAHEEQRNLHPRIELAFQNTTSNGLGKPLPEGIVRFFQESQGAPVFLGEDQLRPTAAGQKARLHPGEAFDVSIHRKQLAFERIAPSARRDDRQAAVSVSYQIEIANAKPVAETVVIEELIPGEWRITEESFEHSKPASGVARWRLRIGPQETKTLRYQARIQM